VRDSTREQIRMLVSRFVRSIPKINKDEIAQVRRAYPFHTAIFSEEAMLYSRQERSVVTKMGMTLFPSLARIVASDRYQDVRTEFSLSREVDSGSLAKINSIMNDLRQGGRKRIPNHETEMASIFSSENGRKAEARVIADLFVGDYRPGPLFMEIKSPLPNIDVAAESKKKILLFELMMKQRRGRGYLAFAYNPYITRNAYAHSFTKTIMDMDKEVLMGSEMWDKLAGEGAYEELLGVLSEAAKSAKQIR
jgi:hypothetical protein